MKIYVNIPKRQVAIFGHVDNVQCGALTMLMRAAAFASDFSIARPGASAVQIRPELEEDFHALYFGIRALAYHANKPLYIKEVNEDAWKAAAIEI